MHTPRGEVMINWGDELAAIRDDAAAAEDSRRALFRCSIARVVFGVSLLGFFWAAYSWIIVFIFLTITAGAIGSTHFSSQEAMYHSQCCCSPRPAIVFLYYATIVNIPLAFVSVLSCIFAVTSGSGVEKLLAGVCLIISAVVAAVEIYFLLKCKRLRERLESDQGFGFNANQVAPEVITMFNRQGSGIMHVPNGQLGGGIVNAQAVPIVMGVPLHQNVMHIAVQPGPNPPTFYRRAQQHQQAAEEEECPAFEEASSPPSSSSTPPSFVTTANTLGYDNQVAPSDGRRVNQSRNE